MTWKESNYLNHPKNQVLDNSYSKALQQLEQMLKLVNYSCIEVSVCKLEPVPNTDVMPAPEKSSLSSDLEFKLVEQDSVLEANSCKLIETTDSEYNERSL